MRLRSSAFLLGTALSVLVAGCGQKATPPSAKVTTPASAPSVAPITDDEAAADKEKRPRFGDAAVYVDGKNVGVLRLPELPSKLEGSIYDIGGGYKVRRYSFHQYARALGFDPQKVKGLHLYGGKRISVWDQAEYRRLGDELLFSFVGGGRGKARLHFPPHKAKVNTTVDMVTSIAFYVEKEPPHLEGKDLVMPDGTPVGDKVPYAPEEQGSGTRLYVDGKLIGLVKRKKVTEDMVVAVHEEGPTRFSLVSYAAKLDPSVAKAKTVELVAGDDYLAAVPNDAAQKITFHVPPRNRGQAVVDLTTKHGDKLARISAVHFHVSTTAPAREIVDIDEAPEAQAKLGVPADAAEL